MLRHCTQGYSLRIVRSVSWKVPPSLEERDYANPFNQLFQDPCETNSSSLKHIDTRGLCKGLLESGRYQTPFLYKHPIRMPIELKAIIIRGVREILGKVLEHLMDLFEIYMLGETIQDGSPIAGENSNG